MTTIITKNSSTASAVPLAADLVQGELAVNVTDKRVYTKNASAAVVELGATPSSVTTGAVSCTTLATSGNVTLGDASTDTLNVGNGGLVKDASGNVGIGTSSFASSARLQVAGGRSYFGSNDTVYAIQVAYNNTRALVGQGFYLGATDSTTPALVFSNADGTERARIDSSGNLLVGSTTLISAERLGVTFAAGNKGIALNVNSGAAQTQILFANPNGAVGSITTTGAATAYVTSSDYRLKNTVEPMLGALAKVSELKPCTYKWNADGLESEGFIAHELAEVFPQAVVGEKDAVDAEGKPVYQGIDTSFLVATLTAAIQEQQAMIEQLKADVAALKGN